MTEDARKLEAAAGQRVYEYIDDNGVVYYSFSKAQSLISPPTRLKMKNHVGTQIISFLAKFRGISTALLKRNLNDG